MARFGEINAQYFDDAGDPLSAGKLYFYESGTTTAKVTFSDINFTIPNTNPVILTAAGRQPNIFFDGNAKAILTNSSDVQIVVRDPVGETASNFGDAWVATRIYAANAVVLGSDNVYYRSLVNANQNNNPTSTSGFWTLLYSVEWSAGITYSIGSVVTYDTLQYQSLQNNNTNQNPSTQTAYWASLAFAWLSTRTYAIHENVVGTDGILYTSLQNSNLNKVPASNALWWVGTSAAAAASATASANSASASASSASSSQTSATASETAKNASVVAKDASVVAKDASVVAKNQAETAKTGAETAQTAAETAKTAAETAETNAETAETNAETAETASSNSAAAALVSQNAAAASATSSASSAASSSTDAGTATTKAGEASVSAAAALVSQNAAAASATTSTTQAGISTTKAGESAASAVSSASSATAAAGSATSAASTLDTFTDQYQGAQSSDPATDPDGGAQVAGNLVFNTTSNQMRVYTGSAWTAVAPSATSVTLSQISDLNANLDAFLATPSSANLITAVTDETGTGTLVFNTSPSLTTPKITTALQDSAGNAVIPFDSNQFFSGTFSDKVTALGNTGSAKTIDLNDGNLFTATLNDNATLTLATPNAVSNRGSSFTLVLTNDSTAGRTLALAGGAFRYAGGSISRTTAANATDIWFFFTPDGGTTYYVSIPMKNLS
ncbi:hypothetical protein N8205_01990 [Flavobacteriaceae bacterium]|nr:hypothetical protein [Flavobacteriaceae bacterium]